MMSTLTTSRKGKANLVYADDRLIILDEQGNVALTSATSEGLSLCPGWRQLVAPCLCLQTRVRTK